MRFLLLISMFSNLFQWLKLWLRIIDLKVPGMPTEMSTEISIGKIILLFLRYIGIIIFFVSKELVKIKINGKNKNKMGKHRKDYQSRMVYIK